MNAPQRLFPNPLVEAAIEYGLGLKIDAPWETNGRGQIIVNPPPAYAHASRVMKIDRLLSKLATDWSATADVALHTLDGIKGPDLTLAAPGFVPSLDARGHLLGAPTICIEVMSPSNSWEEMQHKVMLYLAAGAREVWVCDEAGKLHFFDGSGEHEQSALIADLPGVID
jgi:hypothetical protein